MTPFADRVFLLFFSGMMQKDIATEVGSNPTYICNIMTRFGVEWIRDNLKTEHKQRILELKSQKKSSLEIAAILGRPWHRSSVEFILKRLVEFNEIPSEVNRVRRREALVEITETSKHTFRCSFCSASFVMSLLQSNTNPDRLCPKCQGNVNANTAA